MYIYLDESGNLVTTNGHFFIVASYTVGDPKRVLNAFRRWQKSKFPRKLRHQAEVKFNNAGLDDKLRLKTLYHLAKQDIRIFYTFLKVKNIPAKYRKKGRVYETGLLYTEIVGSTLDLYLPIKETQLIVIRDQRTLKSVNVKQFNETLKTSLLPKLPAKVDFQVTAVDSTSSANIQVADWIAGALARYHEGKPMGEEFYEALKSNIVGEKELFSEYWTKLWEK
jgi:hypothetical protein